jgi:hypothetical protein
MTSILGKAQILLENDTSTRKKSVATHVATHSCDMKCNYELQHGMQLRLQLIVATRDATLLDKSVAPHVATIQVATWDATHSCGKNSTRNKQLQLILQLIVATVKSVNHLQL